MSEDPGSNLVRLKARTGSPDQAPDPAVTPPPAASGPPLVEDLVMGLRFYSRLPTGKRPHETPNLDRIARALPFASIVIGIGPAALLMLTWWMGMPALFAAALAVGALLLISGAMAEDGLADAADGLFGGDSVERRLEMMKDSRHGTYGVAALCLFLLLRVAALGAAPNGFAAAGMWLAAMVIARSGALWLTLALPAVRSGGVSASAGRVGKTAFVTGTVFAVILSFVLAGFAVGVLGLLIAFALAIFVAFGWTRLCRHFIGGQTGDVIGALQALIEIAVLAGFMIFA